jgi:hypothetical protein
LTYFFFTYENLPGDFSERPKPESDYSIPFFKGRIFFTFVSTQNLWNFSKSHTFENFQGFLRWKVLPLFSFSWFLIQTWV